MQPFRKLRWYLAYGATGLVLLVAMSRGAPQLRADPEALFEQLGGTEVPNPVFDNVLTIARDTLAILMNMIPG